MTDHPLVDDDYPLRVATRAIERLGEAILIAVEDGFDALQVHSRAGNGKTSAAEYLGVHQSDWLTQRSAMALITIPRRTNRSDNALYKRIQRDIGAPTLAGRSADDRLNAIIDRLCAACLAANRKRFFLFIDEAQRLSADDYEYLANIYDLMRASGFWLFSIFLNQSDDGGSAHKRRRKPLPSELSHTLRRFLLRHHTFHGIRGLEEIAYVLNRYDLLCHEGVPLPATFAANAWSNGWRLSSDASTFVTAIHHLRSHHGLPNTSEVPMSVFAIAIRRLLVRTAGDNPSFIGFSADDIATALVRAGYVELERIRQRQVVPND